MIATNIGQSSFSICRPSILIYLTRERKDSARSLHISREKRTTNPWKNSPNSGPLFPADCNLYREDQVMPYLQEPSCAPTPRIRPLLIHWRFTAMHAPAL